MVNKRIYTWDEFDEDVEKLTYFIKDHIKAIYGIPRGGVITAIKLSNLLGLPVFYDLDEALKDFKQEEILIVDDISDKGNTFYNIAAVNNYQTASLFVKKGTKFIPLFFCRTCEKSDWVCFPWESENKKMKRDNE